MVRGGNYSAGHANYVIGDLDTAARVLPNVAYSEAAPR